MPAKYLIDKDDLSRSQGPSTCERSVGISCDRLKAGQRATLRDVASDDMSAAEPLLQL